MLEDNPSREQLKTLLHIQRAITSHLDYPVVLQHIVNEARDLTGSRAAVVFFLEDDELRAVAVAGADNPKALVNYRMPVAGSLIGLAIETGEPVRIADAQHDPHVLADPRRKALVKRAGLQNLLTVPLLADHRVIGAISLSDKLNGSYNESDEQILTLLASSAVIALENAKSYEAEQTRRQMAESLRETLTLLNANRPLPDILTLIVEQIAHFTGTAACIYQFDVDTNSGRLLAASGLPEAMQTTILDLRLCAFQTTLVGQPSFVPNIFQSVDKPENEEATLTARSWRDIYAQYFKGFIAIPLIIQDHAFGGLGLFYEKPRLQFSEDEVNLSLIAGEQAALAIENARLRQQVQQAAIAEERNRLARELHDSVTQSLYSLTLFAEATRHMLQGTGGEVANHISRIKSIAQQALKEMRLLVYQLRPPVLEEKGLVSALRQRLEAVEGRAGVETQFVVDELDRLPTPVEDALYWIAQEALNNTLKHASATAVKMRLTTEGSHLSLEITDNGDGFDPMMKVDHGGMGLVSVRERVEQLGGRLEIHSAPGSGTTIRAIIDMEC